MSGLFSLQWPLAPQPTGLGALSSLNALANYTPPRWIAVRQRFAQFHLNLALTPLQVADGHTKLAGVVSCLNRAYYGTNSNTDNSFFVGPWAKDTATRPPRDVDLYFLLPADVYNRFQSHIWNRQSALLQEVKNRLVITYSGTFRQAATITALGTYEELQAQFAQLIERMEVVRTSSLTPPEWCFEKARNKIQAGHYTFSVEDPTNQQ